MSLRRNAQPLAGRRILSTRASAQAHSLRAGLERLGAVVLDSPAIRIADPPDPQAVEGALDRLADYDWIVFTSQNTFPRLRDRLAARGLDPEAMARAFSRARIAAIGEATARGLRDAGLRVEVVPERFRAEAVAERLEREPLAGRRILLPRALVAREVLPDRLRAAGAIVDVVAVYRTLPAALQPEARSALAQGRIDAVTFTSPSTVDAFLDGLGEAPALQPALLAAVRRATLVSIGPVTTARLVSRGFEPVVEAIRYTIPGLVEALADYFARNETKRAGGAG